MNELLEKLVDQTVLVYGDVMLDRYWTGNVERISPEAPVPVVSLTRETLIPGGAANVAANVAGLRAKAILISAIGTDEEGDNFSRLIADNQGVDARLYRSETRKTSVKSRVMAGHQQIVRIDSESVSELNERDTEPILKVIDEVIGSVDAIVISDYGKGVVSKRAAAHLINRARESGVPVLVDPKGIGYEKYKGATILTPNKKEALEVYSLRQHEDKSIENAGKFILDKYGIENVLITLGPEGMALFEKDGEVHHLNASARNVFDVTGAGDTVIAVFATALAAGSDLKNAAELANLAAGKVVETVGTKAIDFEALAETIKENHQTGTTAV